MVAVGSKQWATNCGMDILTLGRIEVIFYKLIKFYLFIPFWMVFIWATLTLFWGTLIFFNFFLKGYLGPKDFPF